MSGLDVVVSDHDGIVTDVLNHPGEEMLGSRINIVVEICCVIALEAVAVIQKDYVFCSFSST